MDIVKVKSTRRSNLIKKFRQKLKKAHPILPLWRGGQRTEDATLSLSLLELEYSTSRVLYASEFSVQAIRLSPYRALGATSHFSLLSVYVTHHASLLLP